MPALHDASWPSRLVLLGHPVGHALSPRMQQAALAAAGIDRSYEALDVAPAALNDTLAELASERAAGNVTIPHKRAVASACVEQTPLAERSGAVNTFWVAAGGTLCGDNTDVAGFEAAANALLRGAAMCDTVRDVVLIGAGGAAAAVCVVTSSWPECTVTLLARDPARADPLTRQFEHVRVEPLTRAPLPPAQLVVNATPIGLASSAHPVAIDALPRGAAVLDLVYARAETAWVRAARGAGHPAADGLRMLVEQGAAAFTRWFGREPDRGVMWRAVTDRETPGELGG